MCENKSEDVKNIGDAGDSSRDSLDIQEHLDSPHSEMVRSIKQTLQCGDHQGLKIMLGKLEMWKQDRENENDLNHDYWRVAQYIGETEMNNLYVLLAVTCEKPEDVKWGYLENALSVMAMCLCNREIIFKLLVYANSVIPILVMAINQDNSEEIALHALSIINLSVTVCRARFVRGLLYAHFLDQPVERLTDQRPLKSLQLIEMVLEVIKSLLMCGQAYIHAYAVEVIQKLSVVLTELSTMEYHDDEKGRKRDELVDFYNELVRSTESNEKPHICAKYWTRGRLRKDLLSESLKQPYLQIYCSWPACENHNGTPNTFFRKCSACMVVRYCSRQCQEKHWETCHNFQCQLISNLGKLL